MFDIGFWELVTIAIIGIVVVGPDKLPEVVRKVMATVRKFRRMFDDVKHDIERELEIDEMRRYVEETDIQEHIRKLNQSVIDGEKGIKTEGKAILDSLDKEIKSVEKTISHAEIDESSHTPPEKPINPEAEKDSGIEHKSS
ncbi:Sec-independent protein translocase protein TatB [Suttonella ornithocola]|uniref:Sec-independent protein translocase protein TatB n=1 Tax=Suttonella ornithocola TaxID=279832 RepID=A0A380MY65_9GAMM|nr:Sec-independent protein translocase protein TatB [Suttonella ornithocola]SUO97218.1 Sec-independent protein translocase protein TatB [Suttonella ornithocola]